jgi:hypothetical protein
VKQFKFFIVFQFVPIPLLPVPFFGLAGWVVSGAHVNLLGGALSLQNQKKNCNKPRKAEDAKKRANFLPITD